MEITTQNLERRKQNSEMAFQIRPLALDHLDAVLAIQASSPEAAQWSRESYAWFLEKREEAAERLAWAAECAGEVAGFLLASRLRDEMEILNLAVTATGRRRGTGIRLVDFALRVARQKDVAHVFLEVRESNAAAVALYQRAGFEISHRRENYYRDPPETALVMTRKLGAAI